MPIADGFPDGEDRVLQPGHRLSLRPGHGGQRLARLQLAAQLGLAQAKVTGGSLHGRLADMPERFAALAPAGRAAQPEEIAAAIAYLASDEASFIHGVTIPVDGGRTATWP